MNDHSRGVWSPGAHQSFERKEWNTLYSADQLERGAMERG
jgi:hypothetical protein